MQENQILLKEQLNEVVMKFVIYKPLIAKAAKAGQFVILRGREGWERRESAHGCRDNIDAESAPASLRPPLRRR